MMNIISLSPLPPFFFTLLDMKCRAIAAAAMGRDTYKVELIQTNKTNSVHFLNSGKVDVLAKGEPKSMENDVYRFEFQTGMSFANPTFFSAQVFQGVPEFVPCSEDFKHNLECQDLKLCIHKDATFFDFVSNQLPLRQLTIVPHFRAAVDAFVRNECNVIIGFPLTKASMEAEGYTGPYLVGKRILEFLAGALTTWDGDPQWSGFVDWVMMSLIAADHVGITRSNILSNDESDLPRFREVSVFGEESKNMFNEAVSEVGSYGEIYNRRFNLDLLPRSNLNYVNNGTTGMIYSMPFGMREIVGPEPSPESTLAQVLRRGRLRCAIRTSRPGFAERNSDNITSDITFRGIDVDYCRAIAAAIFSGAEGALDFVEVHDEKEAFELLDSMDIDVFAGAMATLENDVLEPSTGVGFAFSRPYFYTNTDADFLYQ